MFRAVDAYYTAVSLHDSQACQSSLQTFRRLEEAGKLPGSAAEALAAVQKLGEQNDWESAQRRLADFMRGQRRGK